VITLNKVAVVNSIAVGIGLVEWLIL